MIFAGRYHGVGPQKIRERIDALMDQFDLHEYAHTKAYVLSGGYKQRFLIARTLIHAPKFIILDEPTVGLDPHIRKQLWEKIKDLKRGELRSFLQLTIFWGKFIDTAILLFTTVTIFTYFLSSYGVASDYGPFILMGCHTPTSKTARLRISLRLSATGGSGLQF